MKKLYFLLLTIFALPYSYGQEFTGTYDFADVTTTSGLVDPTAVPTATGLTFGSFSVVNPNLPGSVNGSSGAGRFSFPNQPLGATNGDNTYANLTGSIDLGVYYQVVLTPSQNFSINLSQIDFRSQRSGTGVRTYAVRSSVDNFTTNLAASSTNDFLIVQPGNIFFWSLDATTLGQNGNVITLGSNFNNITTPVTFRFYAWNAEGTGGNFSIDDVIFTGQSNTLGLNQNAIAGLKVYPNPVVDGTLYISTQANAERTIQIYDILGKQVANKVTSNEAINVSNLNAGIYIVKITEEGKTASRKLVIN